MLGLVPWLPGCVASTQPVPTAPLARLGTPAVIQIRCHTPIAAAEPARLFEDVTELTVDALAQQVLARNPSLAQMAAAWQAAQARYPQVTALDDPMVGAVIGPASIGSSRVDFAYRLEISQKLPFPGKRALRGEGAAAEADAAARDVDDMRLQLLESAKNAFFDYYLLSRLLMVNEDGARLISESKENAAARYRNGQVTQQDVLQADVEQGRQKERWLELEQQMRVARARINTLLHVAADSPLPPPPSALPLPVNVASTAKLREAALTHRPDLQALANRIAADEASLELAHKERGPDIEVMAAYDAFWQSPERDLRTMLGVKMNLPVRGERRQGAISEAQAKISQRRAELARLTDQVSFQVEEAASQVEKNTRVVRLYEGEIIPAALANVKSAQAAYVTGKAPFLSLVEAQRNVIMLRERHHEAVANLHRGMATLERATGGVPASGD